MQYVVYLAGQNLHHIPLFLIFMNWAQMINKSFPVTLPYLSTLRQPMLKPENKRMANPYLLTFRLPLPTVTNVQFHGKCSAHFQQTVPVSWCAAETNPHIIWRFRYIANESVPRIIHLRCAPVAVVGVLFPFPAFCPRIPGKRFITSICQDRQTKL